MSKYTEFDKQSEFEESILPKIQELLQLCNKEQLPVFISVATKNSEDGTKYYNDMFSSATNDIFLKDDYFPNLVNVMNGFRTVPPTKIVEVDYD